ncbi:Choline kinase [Lecanosticta acicola]|uniref:Choline kinase n=1 Tax=Lecanosticta acicola TaxID=111012 RepID=A0AAI9E3S3_9PEZI|nr:Choline kinase [Lecanosticta acicola]
MPHSEATSPQPSDKVKSLKEDCASPSSYLGISQAISPKSTPKSVSIAPYAETISPLILGQQKPVDELQLGNERTPKRPSIRSPRAHRLSGRRSNNCSPYLKPTTPTTDGAVSSTLDDDREADDQHDEPSHLDALVEQVTTWIKDKREKRLRRKARRSAARHGKSEQETAKSAPNEENRRRRGSDSSDGSIDLEKLERILKDNLSIRRPSIRQGSTTLRSRPSIRKLLRKQSTASDTEETEFHVPGCDAYLDNSKTLAYTGGASDFSDDSGAEDLTRVPSYRDFDAWARFKFDIVRIAHTLRLKGWRKVPMEMSGAIEVQRLSGALTNAVYVVSPPADLPTHKDDENGNLVTARKAPPKLLLRIYGPQVEHLIDRDAELAILRRLARQRIGPRLLGTFANGRFEEYLHAKPLTPEDLRDPSTSRQIAKRMRELHEGIELLDQERDDGAFVWRNWDKWVNRVEKIVTWMDAQVRALEPGTKPTGSRTWLRRGFICGVPWECFKEVVEKYRKWLREEQCGGVEKLREQLVFAHNDTQYGNILRLVPTGESPLLLPANTHKQLVVIDFEYSNANTPGLEFANHFTEWCYNYHDEKKPYAFNASRYPTPEEQDRFVRAYVQHHPQFSAETPKMAPSTPSMTAAGPGGLKRATTSISDFMLDARSPRASSSPTVKDDAAQKIAEDAEVDRLMNETRMWRLANTAQWVAWGLVQAKVPGMPLFDDTLTSDASSDTEPEDLLGERAEEYKQLAKQQQGEEEEAQEEFDYLGYAQHRALFFWGDAIRMGFIKAEELPEETREKVKTVPY